MMYYMYKERRFGYENDFKNIMRPAMFVMWLVIRAGAAVTYVSGLILSIISTIFVLTGIVYILTEGIAKGLIGFAIAYLLSPYGIQMFVIMILGLIQRIRENMKYYIYR